MTELGRRVAIYDTTLRDGSQGEGISFSVEDKVRIALKLDAFGVDYIEGGWPGSNPKDIEFFARMKQEKLSHAKLVAFGSTRRPNRAPADDPMIQDLLNAETPVITFVGKSWDFQVAEALRIPLNENLRMIADTTSFFKSKGKILFYDAEHFFDGYEQNAVYALKCLSTAVDNGIDCCVLCDTNGGTLPHRIHQIVTEVRKKLTGINVGIHTHNDSECGVANSIAGVRAGATQVQGTINGYGERTGNANLTSIIPALALKLHFDILKPGAVDDLLQLSAYVDEVSNVSPRNNAPYVGRSAFAHKGGLHVDAIRKHPKTYEHIDPASVGNERRILVSELSGSATILEKVANKGLHLDKNSPATKAILRTVAEMENDGYSFEGAEASFELLIKKCTGDYEPLFTLKGYRVIVEKRGEDGEVVTEAAVKIEVAGREELTVSEGDGPVNALDGALRKALYNYYPDLANIILTDFKVRVINQASGTAARVRTIVESKSLDPERGHVRDSWSTVGVSTNVIEASWIALVQSIEYGLNKIDGPR
jgi:2-isopropylmalate synthase